ncbi:hypothetical protein THAOC_13664, partial [Thalassiosira oceanica]
KSLHTRIIEETHSSRRPAAQSESGLEYRDLKSLFRQRTSAYGAAYAAAENRNSQRVDRLHRYPDEQGGPCEQPEATPQADTGGKPQPFHRRASDDAPPARQASSGLPGADKRPSRMSRDDVQTEVLGLQQGQVPPGRVPQGREEATARGDE